MESQSSQADPYFFSIPEKLGGKKQIIFFLTRSAVSNPLSELCLCCMEMKQKLKRLCGEALKRKKKKRRREKKQKRRRKRRDGEFFQKA